MHGTTCQCIARLQQFTWALSVAFSSRTTFDCAYCCEQFLSTSPGQPWHHLDHCRDVVSMLRRLPRCLLAPRLGVLRALSSHALQEVSPVTWGVSHVAAGQQLPSAIPGPHAGSSSSWSAWKPWSAVLGVAAAAAWHSKDSRALADARPDKAWHTAAEAAAEQSISDAFAEALLDWQRSIAQRQPTQDTASSSTSSAAVAGQSNGPERPSVTYDGFQVSVNIPLLPGVDLPALLRAVQAGVDQLAANSRRVEQQQQSWLLSTQRVQHWQLRRLVGGKADRQGPGSIPAGSKGSQNSGSGPSSMQQLSVNVVVPLQGASPHEASSSGSSGSRRGSSDGSNAEDAAAGYVQVAKAAPFTVDELEVLGKLVAAANKPGTGQGFGQPETFFSPWGFHNSPDKALGGFDKLGGAIIGNIFAELLQEFQSCLDFDEQQQRREDGTDWGSRVERIFGGLNKRLGEGLESQLGDHKGFEEQLQGLQQLLQRELRAMTPDDVMSWLHHLTDQEADAQGDIQGDSCPLPSRSSSSSSPGARDGQQQQLLPPTPPHEQQQQQPDKPLLPWQQPSAQAGMRQLEQLGAAVYMPTASALSTTLNTGEGQGSGEEQQQWGVLAGYEAQKQALEDCLLLPLKHPEVYERVSSRTRASSKAGGARPRAVLFEGPPGTGKTSTARVLAGRASLPLVYVPLESLVSKWYGESEQNMAKIFKGCEALGGCIIFLDELDSLATSRDQGDMHEASRRLLGVLLREIDGFNHRDTAGSSSDGGGGDSSKRSVVIGATNRQQDLDAALLSRFDLSIHFGLPDEPCRTAILQQYAHQLSHDDRERIAAVSQGFSGRDLRDVCEQTERAWASKIIRGQVEDDQLPGVDDYLAAVKQRREGAGRAAAVTAGGPGGHTFA